MAAVLARRSGILDRPAGRKAHEAPTPLLGGAAVVVGWVVGLAVVGDRTWALGIGAVLAWLLGTVDDVKTGGLNPAAKLGGQFLVVAVWMAVGGFEGSFDGLCVMAGVLWVVMAMNGYNLLDNTDGLCLVAALPPALGLALLATAGWAPANVGPALVLAGALAGLVPHNWPRARIFLGDGGSHFIGFVLGALSLRLVRDAGFSFFTVLAGAALFVLPFVDTATVVVSRLRRGRPLWVGDRRHLSHRLLGRGFRETTMLAILAGSAAAGTLVAWGLMSLSG